MKKLLVDWQLLGNCISIALGSQGALVGKCKGILACRENVITESTQWGLSCCFILDFDGVTVVEQIKIYSMAPLSHCCGFASCIGMLFNTYFQTAQRCCDERRKEWFACLLFSEWGGWGVHGHISALNEQGFEGRYWVWNWFQLLNGCE